MAEVKLAMWDFKHCDPNRCSGRKLKRLNKLTVIRHDQRWRGIILTASAGRLISREDCDKALKGGIAVIDCSWNRIHEVPVNKLCQYGVQRRLPFLIAANPCHFGRERELNCAEALTAALYVLGFGDQAVNTMNCFSWGHSFFGLNADALDKYHEEGTDFKIMLEIEKSVIKLRTRQGKKIVFDDILPHSSDESSAEATITSQTSAWDDSSEIVPPKTTSALVSS